MLITSYIFWLSNMLVPKMGGEDPVGAQQGTPSRRSRIVKVSAWGNLIGYIFVVYKLQM